MQKLPVLLHQQNLQLSNMPNARQKAKNLSSLQQLRLLDVFSSFIAVTDLQMSVTADDSYMILTLPLLKQCLNLFYIVSF